MPAIPHPMAGKPDRGQARSYNYGSSACVGAGVPAIMAHGRAQGPPDRWCHPVLGFAALTPTYGSYGSTDCAATARPRGRFYA